MRSASELSASSGPPARFPIARLYAIIDPAQAGGHPADEVAEALLRAGVKLIQYRDKRGSSRQIFEAGRQIAELARHAGSVFIVNDRADVALAVHADGVHLGQEDLTAELARRVLSAGAGRTKWIGVSTHTLAQVRKADRSTTDYIAFGPIFATRTKERPDPAVGLEGLREARRATAKPLVAIGGVTLDQAHAVIEAGADSVAVISDLLRYPDIGARAGEFLKALG